MSYRFHHLHGVIPMPYIPRFRCFQIHQPSFASHAAIFHIPHSYISLIKTCCVRQSYNNLSLPSLALFFHEKVAVCAHSS